MLTDAQILAFGAAGKGIELNLPAEHALELWNALRVIQRQRIGTKERRIDEIVAAIEEAMTKWGGK